MTAFRAASDRPVNLNFFCHAPPDADPARLDAWRERLAAYYAELGVDADAGGPSTGRTPFDAALTEVVEELAPTVVSFHFGLPADALVERVRATGATVVSSATTVAEARWLEDHGCDAVIAQGIEAGGHRGMFLTDDLATQVGTMALVPQVVDAVEVPVIAAGGIADGRGIAAALALGADAVQLGTAFLRCPEALTGELHREALAAASEDATALTNVFTGRPARGIVNRVVAEVGPLTDAAPAFPTAVGALDAAAGRRRRARLDRLHAAVVRSGGPPRPPAPRGDAHPPTRRRGAAVPRGSASADGPAAASRRRRARPAARHVGRGR